MKFPSRAELGHFNFRAETELTKKANSQLIFPRFYYQKFLSKKATSKYVLLSNNVNQNFSVQIQSFRRVPWIVLYDFSHTTNSLRPYRFNLIKLQHFCSNTRFIL